MPSTTLPETTKTPFLAWEVLTGQAPRGAEGLRRCVIVAPQNHTPGTAAVNTLYQVPDATTAATLCGWGSPAHRMRIAAAEGNKNTDWWLVVAADSTAPAATAGTGTTTCTGAATESRVMNVRIGDTTYLVSVTNLDLAAVVSAAIIAATGADPACPVVVTGVTPLTFTMKTWGSCGTSVEWYIDNVPAGIVIGTPTGSCTTTAVGVPKWSDAFAAIEASTRKFTYIVPASATLVDLNTGTGNLRDRIGADALAGVRKRMHVIVASKDTQGNAATFSSGFDTGTVTAAEPGIRFSCLWGVSGLIEEWVTAARWCSIRAGLEELDPNVKLAGVLLTGAVPPPAALADPTAAQIEAALRAGCSPITYDHDNSTCTVVLSITCKDTTGGAADYRAWTTNKPIVCDYIADDLEVYQGDMYAAFRVANDVDGKPPTSPPLPKKTTTPSLIGDNACDRLNEVHYAEKGLIEQVKRSEVTVVRNIAVPSRVDQWADVKVIPWLLQMAGELHEVSA
jgi:phage tail sheath gpL-like